jgi:hypothetical protein
MKDRSVEAVYPLSPTQEGMLFGTLFAGESKVYVEQRVVTYRRSLDVACLKLAWIDNGESENHDK